MHVAIVDYGIGNLGPIFRAVTECGGDRVSVTGEPDELASADKRILPGVGAFPDGMKSLRASGIDTLLATLVKEEERPLLGICLGMQLLASRGNEGGTVDGLALIPGEVKLLVPQAPDERIPHIGWNEVHTIGNPALFAGIEQDQDFYFVHSYHFMPADPADCIGTTPYCGSFAAAVQHGSVTGVQFHPEKSGVLGYRLLKNFLKG